MFEGLSDKEKTTTTTTTTTTPSYRTDESSSYKTDEIENIEQIVRKNENTDIIEISRDIDLKSQLSENFLKITNQLDDWYKLGRSLNAIISEFNDTFIELFEINRVHNKPYPILDYSITIDEEEKIKPDNLETNIRCPDNSENYLKIMYYDRLKSEVKKKLELTDDVLDTDNKKIIESGKWKDVPLNENGVNRRFWEKTKEGSKGLIGFLGSYSFDGGLKKMALKALAAASVYTISGLGIVPTFIIYLIAALDFGNFSLNKFKTQAKYINEKYSYPKVFFICEKEGDGDDDEKKTQKGGGDNGNKPTKLDLISEESELLRKLVKMGVDQYRPELLKNLGREEKAILTELEKLELDPGPNSSLKDVEGWRQGQDFIRDFNSNMENRAQVAVAKFPYSPKGDESELAFKEGEEFYVDEDVNEHWLIARSKKDPNKSGYVPKNHVDIHIENLDKDNGTAKGEPEPEPEPGLEEEEVVDLVFLTEDEGDEDENKPPSMYPTSDEESEGELESNKLPPMYPTSDEELEEESESNKREPEPEPEPEPALEENPQVPLEPPPSPKPQIGTSDPPPPPSPSPKPQMPATPPSEEGGNKQSQQNGDEEEQPKTDYYSWKKIKNEGEFLKIDENNDDKYRIDKNIIFRKPIFSDNYNKHLDRVEEDLTELFTKPAINKIRSWLNIEEQYYSFKTMLPDFLIGDGGNINKLEKSAANKRKLLQMGGSGSDNDVLSGGILSECNQTASIDSLMKMATNEYPCILEIGGGPKNSPGNKSPGNTPKVDPEPEVPESPGDVPSEGGTKEEIISKLSNYKDKADSEIDPRGFNLLRLKRTEEEFNKDLKRWKLSQFDDIQLINEFKKYKTSVEKGDETSNNKLTKLQKEYIKKFNDRIANIDSKDIPYDPYDFRFLKSINYDNTSFPAIRINDKSLPFNDLSNKSRVDNLYHKLRKKYEKKRLDEEEIIVDILTDYGLDLSIIPSDSIDNDLFTAFRGFFKNDDRERKYVFLDKEKIDEILSGDGGERDLENLRKSYNHMKSNINIADGGGQRQQGGSAGTHALVSRPQQQRRFGSSEEDGGDDYPRATKPTDSENQRSTRSTRSKGYLENPIDKLLEVIDNQEGDGFDYKFGSLKDDYKKKKKNIKDIGKYLAVLNDLKLEFEDRKKRVERQIENDKSNDNKDKYDIKEITKRPNFLDNSYITLFQSVCGIKATLMWYGDAKDGAKQKYVNTIKDTKVSFNDGVLTMPWQKSLGDGDNKYWEQYIREILPFFSLTEGKYDSNNEVESEILGQNTEEGEESRGGPDGDVPHEILLTEDLESTQGLKLQPEPEPEPALDEDDLFATAGRGGEEWLERNLIGGGKKVKIMRLTDPNPQDDIFYNIKLDEQDGLWKEPINKNGIKIDPPLIKLIYLKSNIIDLSKIFYKNASLIEQNLKLYNELNNLINKSDKDDERDIDEDTNEDSFREMSSDSSTPSDSILSDNKTSVEYIEKEREDKEPKQERKEEEKIELDKRLYSSSELEDLQKDLERLKLEIKEKELAIKNMNINISRLERLGHGEESEERQRAIKDYEYGQKKLILLNKLVKQRQDRIDNLSELLKEIKNNNSRIIREKYEDNKLQEEINELQLKSRLKETIKNKTDKDNLLYKSLKDSEFKTMEQKLRDIEERENNIKIESIRNDRNNKDDLSKILFKDKVRTPRKRRKKKKNKTLKK